MSGNFWRVVVALAVLAHGIGHVLFLTSCLGMTQWGQPARSWLLTRTLGDVPTRVIGSLLWLAVIAGFLAAGVGLLGGQTWWRLLSVGAATGSLLALVLFATGIDTQPLLSAALMDVAILVALLWAQWPSADLVGA